MIEPAFLLLGALAAGASIAALVGIRRSRPRDPLPWGLVSLAMAFFAVAAVAAALLPPDPGLRYPGVALLVFLCAYGPFIGALLRLEFPEARFPAIIDAAILAIAVTVSWWIFAAGRFVPERHAATLDLFLTGISPALDLVLLLLAARLLRLPASQRPARLVAASAACFSVTDLINTLAPIDMAAHPVVLAGWAATIIAAAMAALDPELASMRAPDSAPARLVASPTRFALLALAGVLGPVLLVAEHAGWVESRGIVLEAGTMLIVLLALLRLWVLNVQEARAMRAAEASRDQLRLVLDAVQMATWEWTRESGQTTRSPGMSSLYGIDPGMDASTLQNIYTSRVHPDDLSAYHAWIERLYEQPGPQEVEHRVVLPDGEVRWLRDRGDVVFGPDGRPSSIRGVTQDITAIKQSAAARRVAEDRLQRVLARLPALVYTFENDALASVSPSSVVQPLFGMEPEEWAATWKSRIHPDDSVAVLAEVRRCTETRDPFIIEYRERAADGSWRWVRDEARWVDPAGGGDGSWLGVQLDITAEADARLALSEAEERYRTLVEGVPGVVYLSEPDDSLRPIFISPQLTAMTGYRPEEWIALQPGWFDCVHPDDRERVVSQEQASASRGESVVLEYRLICRDGREIHIRDEMSPVLGAGGSRQLWQGFMLDMTAEVEAAQALRTAWEEAEESNRLKSAFLSTISHELRTPMNGIIGYAGLLLAGLSGPLTPQQEEDVRQISASGDRLLALIDELLDLSRVEAGVIETHPEAVALADALDEARAQLAPLAAAADLWLRTEVAPGTPDAWVDRTRLNQMLLNLAGNAIKFTHEGGVTLSAGPAGGGVEIVVRDTGIGIAPEDLPSLFEPFWQADRSAKRRYGGAGLGLPITRRIAEAQGGRIEVESEPGAGSVFRLWLPAAPKD